jgi:hypothetical protein
MAGVNVKVDQQNGIKVRVGQQNGIKIVSSSVGSDNAVDSINAINVIGGIASVTTLSVSGFSTFVGVSTFKNNVFIDGSLSVSNQISFDELIVTGYTTTTNLRVGVATVTGSLYYNPSYTSGIAYFSSNGLMVSTGATSSAITYTNYILTTDDNGIPTWTSVIDGGSY